MGRNWSMKKVIGNIILSEEELESIYEEAREDAIKKADKYLEEEKEKLQEEWNKLKQYEDRLEIMHLDLDEKKSSYIEEMNILRYWNAAYREQIGMLKRIIKDKKMAYLKQLAKYVPEGRIKREVKKANKEFIALDLILNEWYIYRNKIPK
jgi:hypothetical protein